MVEIFLDGADLAQMRALESRVAGFTTNPSLMKKSGVLDYRAFARAAIDASNGKPISFEVLADDAEGISRQAREIASWGPNVCVKVPITDTRGAPLGVVIRRLALDGIRVNVTAVLSEAQAGSAGAALYGQPGIVSVFAGRIADCGRDPLEAMISARRAVRPPTLLLWASPRQAFDIVLAERAGCDVITLQAPLLEKAVLFGMGLEAYSLETVRQFYNDAKGIEL